MYMLVSSTFTSTKFGSSVSCFVERSSLSYKRFYGFDSSPLTFESLLFYTVLTHISQYICYSGNHLLKLLDQSSQSTHNRTMNELFDIQTQENWDSLTITLNHRTTFPILPLNPFPILSHQHISFPLQSSSTSLWFPEPSKLSQTSKLRYLLNSRLRELR